MISGAVNCALCAYSEIRKVAEFKATPYGSVYYGTQDAAQAAPVYPIDLRLCQRCGLLQLRDVTVRERLEQNYRYDSSKNLALQTAQSKLAFRLVRGLSLSPKSLIIGAFAGDGEGLVGFQNLGMEVAGFDPSFRMNEAVLSEKSIVRGEQFDENLSNRLRSEFGLADIVTCWFRLANYREPLRLLKLMRDMLKPSGSLSILTGYHPDQFAVSMFEYINHDHFMYFDVQSMKNLAAAAGLKIVGVERLELRGGAIHFELTHANSGRPEDSQVLALIQREDWIGIREQAYFDSFLSEINGLAKRSLEALRELRSEGLVGLGASISANQLLHQFGLGDLFSMLLDDDREKIGKFSPGFGLEVSPISNLGQLHTNSSLVLLSWQHEAVLVSRAIEEGYRGKLVAILPRSRTF